MLTGKAVAKNEGLTDFRAEITVRCSPAMGDIGKAPQAVLWPDMAIFKRGPEAAAAGLYHRVEEPRVAQRHPISQPCLGLSDLPATESKCTFLPSRAHMTVDECHIVTDHDGPLRMSFNHRVDDAAAAANDDLLQ